MSTTLKIVCNGRGTYLELDGKTLGDGVKSVKFEHDGATRKPTLDLQLDLADFRFMPDGKFKEVSERMDEEEPPEALFERLK